MEKAKKSRAVLRAGFTKLSKKLEDLMASGTKDRSLSQPVFSQLELKNKELEVINKTIYELLLDDESITEQMLITDTDGADEYQEKYLALEYKFNSMFDSSNEKNNIASENEISVVQSSQKKYKLPLIEWNRFGGDIKTWLPFWSQFRKVHDDKDISDDDKLQYLLQATIPGSRARSVVEGFPLIGENYVKAIESLKLRFGRDDLLVEVYIRELICLVIGNVNSVNNLESLTVLYDKLESYLRSLETLGVTNDKYAAMLYPLVESSLPEDVLKAWQRSSFWVESDINSTGGTKNRLEKLMQFLRKEVEGEERIQLARNNFLIGLETNQLGLRTNAKSKLLISSASALFNKSQANEACIFCNNKNHVSADCFGAKKMSLDERTTLVKKSGSCFRCLLKGHLSLKCKAKLSCPICRRRHVPLMCSGGVQPDFKQNLNRDTSKPALGKFRNPDYSFIKGKEEEKSVLTNFSSSTSQIVLQTLVVKISGHKNSKLARVLIDSGSQRSYIVGGTAEKLGCSPLRKELIRQTLFGGVSGGCNERTCHEVKIKKIDGSFSCNIEALDEKIICKYLPPIKLGKWVSELESWGIKLTDVEEINTMNKEIDLLIGADHIGEILTGNIKKLCKGLVAVETKLGWTLMGKVPKVNNEFLCGNTLTMLSHEISISDMWRLDVLGIEEPETKKSRQDRDEAVNKHFRETVTRMSNGRYQIKLPWIEGHPPLPTNLEVAKKRLVAATKKLENGNNYERYDIVLKDWLKEGIIEEAYELEKTDVHYLPHRAVIKENRATTKVRPVFDASSKMKGSPSINECLDKGPNLIEDLQKILFGFRLKPIGLSADIRKAFLQISIDPKDRDYLRFLWWQDCEQGEGEKKIKIYRHCRVVFGVTCSPFLLGATIQYHLEQCIKKNIFVDTCNILIGSFYVDNLVTSVNNLQELEKIEKESIEVMAAGSFDLASWEYASSKYGINKSELDREESLVLGLIWNREEDTLKLNIDLNTDLGAYNTLTNRMILSYVHKHFDYLGFASPASLYLKLILRQSWNLNKNWDKEVSDEVKFKFLRWVKEIEFLKNIKIPRWVGYLSGDCLRVELHTFCDASQWAYASVVFLRLVYKEEVKVVFLQGKTRLAPIKGMTIPRLELLAATIGARLTSSILSYLNITVNEIYCWTDSTAVLGWIQKEDIWTTFVSNRTKEIRKLTKISSWKYIPSSWNAADLASRGCRPKKLIELKWWEGPMWLSQMNVKLPSLDIKLGEEIMNSERNVTIVSSMSNVNSCQWCENIIVGTGGQTCCKYKGRSWFYRYFSKYEQIVRLVGWISRFVNNCRGNKNKGELTLCELELAEIKVIKYVQEETFGNNNSSIKSLDPHYDKAGILRVKSKIVLREDNLDFRYPIILPASHDVVVALIRHFHLKNCHAGTQILLNIIREKFWIIKGRRTIRSVLSKCVVCRRQKSNCFQTPPAPLPRERVRDARVFEVTGVDMAGPLILRGGEKAWVCLFTCAIYRAVHLELCSSLSTECFIEALRRFIARRGRPSTIFSDNGLNFVGANNEFGRLDWTNIKEYSDVERIIWKFNPPTGAWWGGWWERLVGLVKQLLRRVLGKACIGYDEMVTILCDCEAVINSRPLTYLGEDVEDLAPLTPKLFLQEIEEVGTPDCDAYDRVHLRSRARYRLKLKEDLRARFRKEYLGQLVQRSGPRASRDIAVGDVVLIGSDNSKRLDWPLALVIEVIPGPDKYARVAKLKTSTSQLLRPIQRLYPLEVSAADAENLKPINKTRSGRLVRRHDGST